MSCRRASPNLHFATCLNVRPAKGCPCPKICDIPPHVWATDMRDLRKRLLRAKKIRTSPHHMFAHQRRAISAEGCPRTNKTCISPHVWASDTPQRVTFRKPPPGCPCRQRAWKLVELLRGNSSVTISVQMTLQEFCRSSIRSGSPASQLLCK